MGDGNEQGRQHWYEDGNERERQHWYEVAPDLLNATCQAIEEILPGSRAEFAPDGTMCLPVRKTVCGRDWEILIKYAEDRPEARIALMPYMVSPTPDEAIRLLNEAGRHVRYLPNTIRDDQGRVILSVVTPEGIRNRVDGMDQISDCYRGIMRWIAFYEASLVDDDAWRRFSGRR